ncbi:MAG: hypothetical protein HUU35_07765 [Armatimonadetes bacterium]|nr:hypothetical protein [Armatimonadota bacterium]
MEEMKELIDEAVVERAILLIGLLGPLVGLLLGGLYAQVKRQPSRLGFGRGFLLGLLGPLVYGLWRLYSWLVRYQPAPDPKDDYFGLERVDILLLNVVIFVTVGALVGWLIRLVRERDARSVTGAGDEATSGG